MNPDPCSPSHYAMKILQEDGSEYQREVKILDKLNSDRIVRVKKGFGLLLNSMHKSVLLLLIIFNCSILQGLVGPSTVLAGDAVKILIFDLSFY